MLKKEKKKKKSKTAIFGKQWSIQNQSVIENIIDVFLAYIEKGINAEGIFRLCGLKTRIDQLKDMIDQDPVNFTFDEETDVHEVSGLLKLFLREMPNPLLTYELYDAFIAAASIEFVRERPVIMKKCLELLPPFNKNIFHKLCLCLNKIMKNSQINKMTAENLATCIVPNVLKPTSTDITVIINDAALQCQLMASFITHVHKYFQPGPWTHDELSSGPDEILDLNVIEEFEPISVELPPENLCATLTVRYRQNKKEKEESYRDSLRVLSRKRVPQIPSL